MIYVFMSVSVAGETSKITILQKALSGCYIEVNTAYIINCVKLCMLYLFYEIGMYPKILKSFKGKFMMK